MLRSRRLPGLRFEVHDPPRTDVLPRLDIACFVGFAASGPLHRPVRVASIAQFEMIFGSDAKLAWDEVRGEQIFAYLAPAVRAFFRNGGRLAWIIRVAGEAQIDHFPIPGLLQVAFDGAGKVTNIRPAYAQARSPGSWADGIRVSTTLMSRSLVLTSVTFDPPQFDATLSASDELVVGDLLRLTFESGMILMCAVKSIESKEYSLQPNQYRVTCDKATWFRASWKQPPPTPIGKASSFTYELENTPMNAAIPLNLESPPGLDWPSRVHQTSIQIDLDLGSVDVPQIGSFLRLDFGAEQFWLRVEDVNAGEPTGSPVPDIVRVIGQGLWWSPTPALLSDPIDLVERLSFEIWTRIGEDRPLRISDLTFDARHARSWDALPTDLQLFPENNTLPRTDRSPLWAAAADPRFPLAGQERSEPLFVPLSMSLIPDVYLAPDRLNDDRLIRDGLKVFDSSLFLDRDLASVGVRDLMNEADTLRYQAPAPRSLTGIHAALEIEEVTLIAVPDAVQRGWALRESRQPPAPLPSPSPLRPEWWHFLDCVPEPVIPAVHKPEWGNFLNCDVRIIDPPFLVAAVSDDWGTFGLSWEAAEGGLTFLLEEATQADFSDATIIYAGSQDQHTVYGHMPGIFYFRVRAFIGDQSSDWSNGVVISIDSASAYQLKSIDSAGSPAIEPYSDEVLLKVQLSVLDLCAARADLFAVLALPEHYLEDDVIAHIQTLMMANRDVFGSGGMHTLSFGAVFHPWLIGKEENRAGELRRTPPDGAVAGIIARRTLARGAWVAPANEFLHGVLALTPSMDRRRWMELQNVQLNLIRHEPKGFTILNNDTLSQDEGLRPINVRRLLILLRRLALRLGATYVFEPNDDAFRRSVQRGFEALLDDLLLRGAFAGSKAATSYQVVTDTSLNSLQAVDQGRYMVELRVAPSLPLRFITVRLVQTGDQTLVIEET